MDFLDPVKKRKHRIRLYIGYGLTAIAIAIATFLLVFAAYGYDIDRRTGGIIQNGLIIIDAHPESANVFINNENKGTTSTRQVLPAGTYNVSLQRNGYRNWEHKVELEGSSIEQLVYPFLFPSKLVTKGLQEYPAMPSLASTSPDRHWLVTQTQPNTPNFTVTDLNNNKNPNSTITVPADIITPSEGPNAYEAVEWSNDNVHLLLKHTYAANIEFIILDRGNPGASININKVFADQQFTNVSLRDKKADQLYLFNASNGNLSAANIPDKSVSLLKSNVISYKPYQSDVLVYVTNPSSSSSLVELHVSQDKNDYLIRTLPLSQNYLLDAAQFNGHFYMVGGGSADGHVYLYKDPFSDLGRRPARTPQPFRVLIVPDAEHVSFSGIARFVAVQNGSNFAIYDMETNRQFRYDIKLPTSPHQKATWMDGHRLALTSQGKVNIFDFDGQNTQTLSANVDNFGPFFDRDYTAMYTIAPLANAPDKSSLNRTELKVLPASQQPTT